MWARSAHLVASPPPSKMYSARRCLRSVTPRISLSASRHEVLPEPFGPVATLIPSSANSIGSGRRNDQWTACSCSNCGIFGLLLGLEAAEIAAAQEMFEQLVGAGIGGDVVECGQVRPGVEAVVVAADEA